MIEFNGRKYAKNDSEFVGSLFTTGGTCSGFYKRVRNGVKLYDMQHSLKAFLVDNSHGERFVVTAHKTEQGDRFMFSTTAETERFLGISGLSQSAERALIDACLA